MTADVCVWCRTYITLGEEGGWLVWRDRHGDAVCPAADDGDAEHEPSVTP